MPSPDPETSARKSTGYNGRRRGRQGEGVSESILIRVKRDIAIDLNAIIGSNQTYNDGVRYLLDFYYRHRQEGS